MIGSMIDIKTMIIDVINALESITETPIDTPKKRTVVMKVPGTETEKGDNINQETTDKKDMIIRNIKITLGERKHRNPAAKTMSKEGITKIKAQKDKNKSMIIDSI
jgi:hypothetical protein